MREKPIAFYPGLARRLGDIASAIYYQQLYFWSDKGDREDGFIYKSKREFEEETTLSREQQDRIRKNLERDGWIETKLTHDKRGKPTIHFKCLIDIEVSISGKPTNGKVGKTLMNTRETHQCSITENTTENTTSEKETFSRRRGSRKSLEELKESIPNTALGEIPVTNHRPPMEVKEEMRVARRMAGIYDNTFGAKAIKIVKYFCQLYDEKYKMPYGKIVQVDTVAKNISTFFKEGETVETLQEMLDLYMNSDKANRLTVRLTTAFSDDTYRAWKQGKLGNPDSAGIYPMKIGHLTARNDENLGEFFAKGWIYSVGDGKWALTPQGKEVRI